jgi:predicted phage terminase large subunit-like protein
MSTKDLADELCTPKSQKQYDFIHSDTDITLFGGAAGSGKTWTGLCRFLRFVNEPLYIGYVIRKTASSLRTGAFETAIRLFTAWESKVKVNRNEMTFKFPSGCRIILKGLDGQAGMDFFQGQEISGAMIDEATHISAEEVSWILTRLRTNSSAKPTAWLTCNPDQDSFLLDWAKWYLHPKKTYETDEKGNTIDVGGRPDPAKNGKVRWYYVIDSLYVWAESKEELIEKYKDYVEEGQNPMSFRFIGATYKDNPMLPKKYISDLMNQSKVEKERLVHGNWYARAEGAGLWKNEWCVKLSSFPNPDDPDDKIIKRVRCWDLAYTEPHDGNLDPDYTVGVLMGKTKNGFYVVEHVVRKQMRVGKLHRFIAEVALKDYDVYGIIPQVLPEDPASGKATFAFTKEYLMQNGVVAVQKVMGSNKRNKLERFKNFASASENGAVYIMEADWNDEYFAELEAFDGTRNVRHDDQVDASSDAFNTLFSKRTIRKNIVKNMF